MSRTLRSVTACAFTAVISCAPSYHTPPSYRFDRDRSAALEARAVVECRDAVGPAGIPKRRFTTDGCTMWPDASWTGSTWQECCVAHDIAYWCGGSPDRRAAADRALAVCVADGYANWMGSLMEFGSRAMAGRRFPAHWRWGYGHDYSSAGPR